MKKNPTSQTGFFNPRLLLTFSLCSAGIFLAMLSFAATPPDGANRPINPLGSGSTAGFPLGTVSGSANSLTQSDWSIVTSPNTSTTQNNLLGVTCVSASDCWAVGSYVADRGAPQTLIEHWDGTAWAIVQSPNASLPTNVLSGVTCLSASGCSAVGCSIAAGAGQPTLN